MTEAAFHLTGKQTEAWDAIHQPGVKRVLFGGAKGGGKTRYACYFACTRALEIIEEFGLKPRQYPIPVGWIGRKVARDFKSTTLETWKDCIPGDLYEIRAHDQEIVILGAVKIDYGGFDRPSLEMRNKFNSAEYAFIVVDQAEELKRDEVGLLRGTLRRTIDGRHPRFIELYTANPAQCWLKPEFIQAPAEGNVFVRALPRDNPHLPPDYEDRLRDAFRHRPDLLAAYLEGSWDAIAEEGQVVLDRWIEAAMGIEIHGPEIRRVLSCDPARFGDDETVIYEFENTRIVDAQYYGKKPTTFTSSKLAIMSRAARDCAVVVDEVGVGAGVVDELRQLGVRVIGVNGAEKAQDSRTYGNLRAEVWDTVASQMQNGDIEIEGEMEPLLRGQLITPQYDFRRGKMWVEDKGEIKQRLARSPDRADAYVQGIWALQFVEPDAPPKRDSFLSRRRSRASRSAMAM